MNPSVEKIQQARNRLAEESIVQQTPIETSRSLDAELDATVRLKMEHLQRTGSFKVRGAFNKLKQVTEYGCDAKTVIAASAGNHAQGVAISASKTGFNSKIVMPKSAPQAKIEATSGYGATVELHGQNFREAMDHAQSLASEGKLFIHAYDDPYVIAGQGTIGIEILEQVPDVDTIVVPIGGGGLIGGIATVISKLSPATRIVGVQTAGAATVPASLQQGEPQSIDEVRTIADGIATGGISERTFGLIDKYVDKVVTVTETETTESLLFLLERSKQLVEAAGATTIAAIRSGRIDIRGETVVPVLSGGNLELTDLQTVLTHGLTHRDQLIHLRVQIEDKPGEMARVSGKIGSHDVNISNVSHERSVKDLNVDEAYLDFRLETNGSDQTERIMESLRNAEYSVVRVGITD